MQSLNLFTHYKEAEKMQNIIFKKVITAGAVCLMLGGMSASFADPAEDIKRFQSYFKAKFPEVKEFQDFADGVYSFDKNSRDSWEEIEEFPPYEINIEDGKVMWEKKFANGKGYANCFPDGPAIAGKYPHWDKEKSMVMTTALAINNCREANDEKPLKYKKGKINDILSYIAFESRGQTINVEIPDDPKALEAYNKGKQFWLAKRGQLNMSCVSCHAQYSKTKIRSEILSPALGQVTHWPAYRSKWGAVGTLHRRFTGCNKQVRAKPFKGQSPEYRNLEYFLSAMSNGLKLNGAGSRK